MDIGYLTFWGAKPDESVTEGYAANLKEVAAADEIGMDSVWVGGVPLGGIQPLQIAPAIAAVTSRIRMGRRAPAAPGRPAKSSRPKWRKAARG